MPSKAADPTTEAQWAEALKYASDHLVRTPLWEFPPRAANAVLHVRRRRFGVPTADDFDPEYH